ncbi:MAG: hypothetical protein QXU69_09850 [Thermofilaceae archaeon]
MGGKAGRYIEGDTQPLRQRSLLRWRLLKEVERGVETIEGGRGKAGIHAAFTVIANPTRDTAELSGEI